MSTSQTRCESSPKPGCKLLECECLLNVRCDGLKLAVVKVSCKELSLKLEEIS